MTSTGNADAAKRAGVALAATSLVSLPLVAGFFGWLHPALDSFSHFRVHLAVLLAICAVWLLATRARLHGAVALALAAGAYVTAYPPSSWDSRASAAVLPAAMDEPVYRLLQLNLQWDSPAPEKALALISQADADVITLDEVSEPWRARLAEVSDAYPFRLDCQGDPKFGSVMILSRRPMIDAEGSGCRERRGFAVATIDFDGRAVEVAAVHLAWPWPKTQFEEVRDLAPRLSALSDATIAAGDFNSVPWSAVFRTFVQAGGFAEPVRLGPTWIHKRLPRRLRRLGGLELDHVLVKRGLRLRDIRRLNDAGSDHLPVLTEFSIRDQPPAGQVAFARTSGAARPGGS
ncbi:endonuclease/exonuclease/phosphatase family protein [Aquibium oceanicum]|uniref:Endonuclease/exonuclease/phosphatase domain-containing protein n=1 Tax=Aquibium oceanicum TaxID=1670800 RepID=A0A1L3SQA5_9HYPH|nr:endonuclease/exonuclease/phosphatase family protein [Aquibium oceanicum]APH71550.1 hypothetical protein BSQ44_09335 [Aquibium oceanicum]